MIVVDRISKSNTNYALVRNNMKIIKLKMRKDDSMK
jgi:hypothetical protein